MTSRVAMCAALPQGRQGVILCDGFQVSFRVLIPDQLGITLGIGVEQVIELGTVGSVCNFLLHAGYNRFPDLGQGCRSGKCAC